jgi:hypothetical protein
MAVKSDKLKSYVNSPWKFKSIPHNNELHIVFSMCRSRLRARRMPYIITRVWIFYHIRATTIMLPAPFYIHTFTWVPMWWCVCVVVCAIGVAAAIYRYLKRKCAAVDKCPSLYFSLSIVSFHF